MLLLAEHPIGSCTFNMHKVHRSIQLNQFNIHFICSPTAYLHSEECVFLIVTTCEYLWFIDWTLLPLENVCSSVYQNVITEAHPPKLEHPDSPIFCALIPSSLLSPPPGRKKLVISLSFFITTVFIIWGWHRTVLLLDLVILKTTGFNLLCENMQTAAASDSIPQMQLFNLCSIEALELAPGKGWIHRFKECLRGGN